MSTFNYTKRFLSAFPFFVIFIGLLFVLYSFEYHISDLFTRISAMSAFFTVILTGLYVIVNSKQLDVMGKQLLEMKSDRELQSQPLPLISNVVFEIEEPRLFSAPSEKFHVFSRYFVNFDIKNVGGFPAVCTDISACIIIPMDKEGKKNLEFCATSVCIDVMEVNKIFNKKDGHRGFLFVDDKENVLIKRLIDPVYRSSPSLKIQVLYKNVLGACFVIISEYHLYLFDRDPSKVNGRNILKNWLSNIVSFPISYGSELNQLNNLKESSKYNDWSEYYDIVQKQFYDSLVHLESNDRLYGVEVGPLRGRFTIKTISEDEYKSYMDDKRFGFYRYS